MSHSAPMPEVFAALTDLSADATGTFVLYATDDYFAAKENLIRPDAPVWKEGEYTDRGKWMDGWESQRRRAPGHDFAIVRLGTPGTISGLLCDTTHFKGNAPQEVALEVLDLPHTATADELLALPAARDAAEQRALGGRAWLEVLPRTVVRPDTANVLALPQPSGRASHVRLHIHPDGGVARLRVYGTVRPAPRVFWGAGAVDLAAIEHGGTIAAASDSFFGPPSNLLLPGRGTHMGDGWETRRRRTPGTDWCVIQLGRRGVVERIELDTHFFKGNAPQAAIVECLDAEALAPREVAERLAGGAGWDTLIERTPLVPHRLHVLEPALPRAVTHLRVHIDPHGGVNRLRAFGHASDTAMERRALAALHGLPEVELLALLRSFCGAPAFAEQVSEARPFGSARAWFAAASAAFAAFHPDDWLAAFAAHPRLGDAAPAPGQTARSAEWSRGEQAGVAGGDAAVQGRLRSANEEYARRFGFIFILCASEVGAGQVLAALEERLGHDRDAELAIAAREQARITRLRMESWLLAAAAG